MPELIECPACRAQVALPDLPAGRGRDACPRCGASLIVAPPTDPGATVVPSATGRASAGAVERGWIGRYRVVGAGRGRAWGFGPEVALSVVRDRWAADPRFVADWVLEALAASELRHPNVLAPGGVEVAGNRVFAARVIGPGRSLDDPVARADLDRRARLAAVLHAARGVQFAHEQGVFARDLDPAALRVDAAGQVGVAGLGVGRTPAEAGSGALGQADVAGLGRTLATLAGGLGGDRAVAPGLAGLLRRLEGAGEPFRDLGAVVRAMEAELGVAGPLTPTDAVASAFEAAVRDYQTAPLLALRRWVAPGFAAVLVLIILLLSLAGRVMPALGWAGFGTLIAASLAGFRAWDHRERARHRVGVALATLGRRDLITLAVVGLLGVGTIVATHFQVTALIVTTIAVALAAMYHFGLDRPLAASRADALVQLRALVQAWRRAGHDETAIRRYVAAAGGPGWEEVFGAIFGLDAIPPARAQWGADLAGQRRPRFAPIRGWLLGRWDAWIARRSDHRTRTWLEPIIERDLESRGMHVLTARRKAKRSAEAAVAVLGQFRRAPDGSVGLPLAGALRRAVEHPEEFLLSPEIAEAAAEAEPPAWWSSLVATAEAACGPRARFLLGAASLAAAFVWMEQNALVSYEEGKQAVLTATVAGDRAHALDQARRIGAKFVAGVARVVDAPDRQNEPMDLGPLPPALAEHLNGFALTATALILLASAFVPHPRIIPFAWGGALVPLVPRLIVPTARPLDVASLVAMAVGLGVFALGLWWDRGRGE